MSDTDDRLQELARGEIMLTPVADFFPLGRSRMVTRLRNGLLNANAHYIGQVLVLEKKDIARIPNLSEKSTALLKNMLAEKGLVLSSAKQYARELGFNYGSRTYPSAHFSLKREEAAAKIITLFSLKASEFTAEISMEKIIERVMGEPFADIRGKLGDAFYRELVDTPAVRAAFRNAAATLRDALNGSVLAALTRKPD